MRNTPIFKKAGEIHGRAFYDPLHFVSTDRSAFDVQAAVSVTNHIGIIGNYQKAKASVRETGEPVSQEYKEAGAGYYRDFNSRLHAEFFAGYGLGQVNTIDNFNSLDNNRRALKLDFNRYFIQGVFGLKLKKVFTIAPSIRVSYVTFKYFQQPSSTRGTFHDGGNFFFEPCATAIFNPGKSKFLSHINIMAQIGFNITVNRLFEGTESFRYEYGYNPFNTALGIGFRLGPIAKKDKE